MSNLNEEKKKKMKNSAQYIYDGEDLGHPYIQSTTVLCDKQLGRSRSPRMRYIQLVIELYVPRKYTAGLYLGASVYYKVYLTTCLLGKKAMA